MLSVGETETERGAGRWEGERERQKPEVSTLTRSRGYKLDQSSSFTNTYGQPPRQTDHRYQLHCWTANKIFVVHRVQVLQKSCTSFKLSKRREINRVRERKERLFQLHVGFVRALH